MPSAAHKTDRSHPSTQSSSPHPLPPPLPDEVLLMVESQWLFSESELQLTPSILAGLAPAKERENRAKGVNFVMQVGIMLKLPQITLAAASVFLHRFFMRHSMVDIPSPTVVKPGYHYYSVAATSLFLATKVEENCRKMRELVVACVRVAQKNPAKVVDEQDKEYWRWRDTILQLEDVLLEAVCFDLSLEPPYKTLFHLLVFFGEENNKPLRNAAWAFLNDSNLTMLCLLFPSRTIAASALYAAARHVGVSFVDDERGRPWWEVVGVGLRDVRRACNYVAAVYENTPLRSGEGGGMHEMTPEEGEEALAKTRAKREVRNGVDGNGTGGVEMGREHSFASDVASEGTMKRSRSDEGEAAVGVETGARGPGDDGIPWGGDDGLEPQTKKRRIVANGVGREDQDHTNGVVEDGDLEASKMDDGSEEGEVEQ